MQFDNNSKYAWIKFTFCKKDGVSGITLCTWPRWTLGYMTLTCALTFNTCDLPSTHSIHLAQCDSCTSGSTLPSSLQITGSLRSMDLHALTMPLAMVAQLTMPPNTLTRMAFTCREQHTASEYNNKVPPLGWPCFLQVLENLLCAFLDDFV